jgi:hypothetical protein
VISFRQKRFLDSLLLLSQIHDRDRHEIYIEWLRNREVRSVMVLGEKWDGRIRVYRIMRWNGAIIVLREDWVAGAILNWEAVCSSSLLSLCRWENLVSLRAQGEKLGYLNGECRSLFCGCSLERM